MADLTKVTAPSLATVLPPASARLSGLLAGEAIAVGDMCYVKSDGLVWRTNGTAANAAARSRGMAATTAAVGEAVTLFSNCAINYSSGLTPGADYYISATPGRLSDAATTGGVNPVAYAVSATKVFVLANR